MSVPAPAPPRETPATLQPSQQEGANVAIGLAHEPSILAAFTRDLAACGVVGEERAAKLLYLVVTTRLFERPVSAVLKGPSSAGKSGLLKHVLDFFPATAAYALSAMSERALAYSQEPLGHRMLVVYEAAGIRGEFATYLMRSLLSEGRVRYETVEKSEQQSFRARLIERAGPTGLLMTTTDINLHPENETRLLSIPVTDTSEQTKSVLRRQAQQAEGTAFRQVDLAAWIALQTGLESGDRQVVIPYASTLAERTPAVALRLRRDFPAVLSLISAHALLHRARRSRDEQARIMAALEDYAAVHELVADLIAESTDSAVPSTVRETCEAVRRLGTAASGAHRVTVAEVARELKLDKSAALRRVQAAITCGYLGNREQRRGRAATLYVAAPLPSKVEVLPPPDVLAACSPDCNRQTAENTAQSRAGCTVAAQLPEPAASGYSDDALFRAWARSRAAKRAQDDGLSMSRAATPPRALRPFPG